MLPSDKAKSSLQTLMMTHQLNDKTEGPQNVYSESDGTEI